MRFAAIAKILFPETEHEKFPNISLSPAQLKVMSEINFF